MYCPFCGKQNSAEVIRCLSCGQSLHFHAGLQSPTYNRRPEISTHLVQAILVTMFCCQPFGIVAIVYAAMASSKVSAGDYPGAMDCSQKASNWCWLAFWLGLIPMAIYAAIMIVGVVTGSIH